MLYLLGLLGIIPVLAIYFLICVEHAPTWKLKGKRIIVTGGSAGLGLSIARQLVAEGASVALIARDPTKLSSAVQLLKELNKSKNNDSIIVSYSADITNQESISSAITSASTALHGVDAIICNAGSAIPGRFGELPSSAYESQMKTNYFGHVYSILAALPFLRTTARSNKDGCRIIVVASMAGLSGVAGWTAYAPAKFALRGFCETLHMELRSENIHISLCCPPDMDTPGLVEENKNKPKECKLIGEGSGLFQPDDVAKDTIAALKSWKFFITTGFDGVLLGYLSCGTAPAHSVFSSFIELFLLGFIRAISLAYRKIYNGIVVKVRTEEKLLKGKNNNDGKNEKKDYGTIESSISRSALVNE